MYLPLTRRTPAAPASVNASSSALLVKLAARPDFADIEQMPRGAERKQAAYDAIVATAKESQAALMVLVNKLKRQGAVTGVKALVSPNMLVVTPASGKAQAVTDALFGAEQVRAIYANGDGFRIEPGRKLPIQDPQLPWWGLDVVPGPIGEVPAPKTKPYGLTMIGAPKAWTQGAEGEGLVYGSVDTGVDVTHSALNAAYRGTDDGTDDYNFFDAGGGTAPIDKGRHGTHTIGTVVGEGIGVAPKAKFVSAAAFGFQIDGILRSLQWMLAPTKMDGTAPDPTRAPDVVGMSWWTGKPTEDLFLESLQDLRAAGIEPIKSAGNNGPDERTISSPGQHAELFAVAAVDRGGRAAKFSSRGPAPFPDGETTPKPDYAAPGVGVVSSVPGDKFESMSGTSMAQPHLSGAVLLLLSKYPELTHDQLREVLTAGVVDKGDAGWDTTFGDGIINVPASLDAAAKLLGRR